MDIRNVKAAALAFMGTAMFYTTVYLLATWPGH